MRTLCVDCVYGELDGKKEPSLESILRAIAVNDLRLTIHPRNCDNARRPGHSQRGPYTLDELPPAARG